MNRLQAHRIRESFRSFEPCGEAFVARVLLRLADRHPGARALFPDGSAELHRSLYDNLRTIVRGLDKFTTLETPLIRLGALAVQRGATPTSFAVVRTELIATMRELMAQEWSTQLQSDWEFALQAVSGAMLRGVARQSKAA